MSSGRSVDADKVVHGPIHEDGEGSIYRVTSVESRVIFNTPITVESDEVLVIDGDGVRTEPNEFSNERNAMSKCDATLGDKVHAHLIECGVETPLKPSPFSRDGKKVAIEKHFTAIMEALGLDLEDDSLIETPTRVAKMYVDEIFYGLDYSRFPKATTVDNKMKYDEMVLVNNISVQSNCEHHFVVITGKATVAYIPKQKVLGLSKINRVVEFFAKRPQIQERMTEQIYHALSFILETEDVAVLVDALHYCVKSRGVSDEGSSTTTSRLGGCFKSGQTRTEFLSLASRSHVA